jgi:hypothetical protein
MKKVNTFLAILILAFILTGPVKATSLFTEDFDYPAGTLLRDCVGWFAYNAITTNSITITSPGLTYPGYPGSDIGHAVTLVTSGEDCRYIFGSINSGTIYASLMINVQSAKTAGDYFFHFAYSDVSFYAKTFIKDIPGQGFKFGLSKNSTTAPNWTTTVYNYSTTYLIVVKYTFVPGDNNDQVDLFINPIPGAPEPSPTLTNTDITSTADPASPITWVCLRQGSASLAPTVRVDGIRVATTWDDLPLPVELSSFTSNVNGRDVSLIWSTQTEKNSDKFNIERKSLNVTWESIGSVKASVLSNSPKQYSFTDKNLQSGKYQYRLKMIDNDGTFRYSSVVEAEVAVPKDFELSQNYPNPFNPNTVISYSLPLASNVKLIVYNSLGQTVKVLENGFKNAGSYSVNLNATELPSGTYYYKIEAGEFSQIKKMMLLK